MPTKTYKTRFDYGDGATHAASSNWTSFARVVEIQPPGHTAEKIDTTHLESEDEFKEYEAGLADGGDATFKVQWDATQNATIYNLFRESKGYRVVYNTAPYPSGKKLKFNGFISGIQDEQIVNNNVVQALITVTVVGRPVLE